MFRYQFDNDIYRARYHQGLTLGSHLDDKMLLCVTMSILSGIVLCNSK